jgi:hypothetical protein
MHFAPLAGDRLKKVSGSDKFAHPVNSALGTGNLVTQVPILSTAFFTTPESLDAIGRPQAYLAAVL